MSRSNISRRDFLKISFTASGALLITACAPEMLPSPTMTAAPTSTPIPEITFEPNLFIHIAQDGRITLRVHRSEMGQGVRTSLAMILAEELEADWQTVHVEQMDVTASLNQVTSGSGSVMINYGPLRTAGAAARTLLIQAAAKTWNVSAAECKAEKSAVIHTSSGKQLGYGELVQLAKDLQLEADASLKEPKDFTIIGTSKPRVDATDIVTGKAIYGLDVRLPGMLFATVARCPVLGGKLKDYDSTQAESVAGVKSVIKISNGVAVVADNTWSAMQGRAALKVNWDEGSQAELSTKSIRQKMVDSINRAVAKENPTELKTIEAIYETPYLAHATMEPMNCIADVRADGCDIWAPTQNPADVQSFVQNIVHVPTNVHVTLLGGGFGRRLEVDFAMEAAEISKAMSVPVQVVWSRDDDLQHDFYRQQTYHWLRAGWDEQGQLSLWRHFIAGQGINGIAYRAGKEVLDEGLEVLYKIPDHLSQSFMVNTAVPTGPWRGVMSTPNAFANECFLDEVAASLKQDPLALRLSLLEDGNPLKAVIQLAAEKSNWNSALPEGHGRGIGCQIYHNSIVVMIADVSVEQSAVHVHNVVCALDCGKVINPDMVTQQVEGSIVFGLTSLFNEITYDKGRVQQSNFHDYPLLQLKDMPQVQVYVMPSENSPQGLGEMGVPPIVPAVMNAIFSASGKRFRHTPIRPEDLQGA